jgi:uncharacterized membrane protein (DUF441 family)
MIDFQSTSLSMVAVVPIIVAVTQAIKMITPGETLHKWSPLISIGLGILFAFFAAPDLMDNSQKIMSGVVYGLSASGLYSGVKSTAHATKNNNDPGI